MSTKRYSSASLDHDADAVYGSDLVIVRGAGGVPVSVEAHQLIHDSVDVYGKDSGLRSAGGPVRPGVIAMSREGTEAHVPGSVAVAAPVKPPRDRFDGTATVLMWLVGLFGIGIALLVSLVFVFLRETAPPDCHNTVNGTTCRAAR